MAYLEVNPPKEKLGLARQPSKKEAYRITVHPNYLEVELDWVFKVSGNKAPAEHKDALEIVGNLNLATNSVVTGLLTWWKGDILKGKLKTTDMARADYEEVVQRDADAPPPPRDPVLLEYSWGTDNYDISIFLQAMEKHEKFASNI